MNHQSRFDAGLLTIEGFDINRETTPASLSVCLSVSHTQKTALGEGTTLGTFPYTWHCPLHTADLLGFFL